MGRLRVEDGHPETYQVGRVRVRTSCARSGLTPSIQARIFELGNEQYNPDYVSQVMPNPRKLFSTICPLRCEVAAMEAKAAEVGMAGELKYMFPNNGKFLNKGDLAAAKAETAPDSPRP